MMVPFPQGCPPLSTYFKYRHQHLTEEPKNPAEVAAPRPFVEKTDRRRAVWPLKPSCILQRALAVRAQRGTE